MERRSICRSGPSAASIPAYAGDMDRILRSLEARGKVEGIDPDLKEIPRQIGFRANVMNISSVRREMSAVRAMLDIRLATGRWPEVMDCPEWVNRASGDVLEAVRMNLNETPQSLSEIHAADLRRLTEDLARRMFDGSEEDAVHLIAGVRPQRHRVGNRDRRSLPRVTVGMLLKLDAALRPHRPLAALKSLGTDRADLKGLLRIVMRTSWLTGARPVEIFGCRLVLVDPARDHGEQDRKTILEAPATAFARGLLVPVEAIDPMRFGSFGAAVREITAAAGIPPVFILPNAKTTNANPQLARPFRAMRLDGIPDDDLEMLCLAAQIHNFGISGERMKGMMNNMRRNLVRISEKLGLPEASRMNLYVFRHDFATRVRRELSLHEVSALMGHTGRRSTRIYGNPAVIGRGGGADTGGWVPRPDMKAAEDIRLAWSGQDLRPVENLAEPVPR